ncbi:MAG: hypothetical protein P4L22_05900 [Candidatus Babeliales bacterium]|nr:hypothetical protein [Candidatus Babeliales bacterium]
MKKTIINLILIICLPSYANEFTYEKISAYDFNDTIKVMCWSPNETYLACATDEFTITVINTKDNSRKVLEGHENLIKALVFSPDGKFLISGSDDITIEVWDTQNWESIFTINAHENSIECLAFSSDSTLCASGSRDGTIKIWNTNDWKCIKTLNHKGYVSNVSFSKNGSSLISYSNNNKTVKTWNLNDFNYLGVINYNDSDNILVSEDMTKILNTYKAKTTISDYLRKNEQLLKLKQTISFVSFSTDASKLRYTIDNQIFIRNISSSKKSKPIIETNETIEAISWSNKENRVAIKLDGKVEIWVATQNPTLIKPSAQSGIKSNPDTDEKEWELI